MSDNQEERKRPAEDSLPTYATGMELLFPHGMRRGRRGMREFEDLYVNRSHGPEFGGDIPPEFNALAVREIKMKAPFGDWVGTLLMSEFSEDAQREMHCQYTVHAVMEFSNMISLFTQLSETKWITWDPTKEFPEPNMWMEGHRPPRMFYGNCRFCKKAGQYGTQCQDCVNRGRDAPYYKPMVRARDSNIFNPLFVAWYYGWYAVAFSSPIHIDPEQLRTWVWPYVCPDELGYDPDLDDTEASWEHRGLKIRFHGMLHARFD